jgi:DNA-binding beta-propeller fold protein YncE
MRIPAPLFALGAAAAIALAGCSGGSAVSPSMGTGAQGVISHPVNYSLPHVNNALSMKMLTNLLGGQRYVSTDAGCGTGALVYASQYYTNAVQIYKQAGSGQSPCATVTTNILNPQGMAVDSKHHVWVANTGDSNLVELNKGSTKIIKTLTDSGEYPVDVCIGSTGNIYATNIITTGGGPGSVSEWVGGKGSPKTLAVPNNSRVLFCGMDNKNNLYVNYLDATSGLGAMVEFVAGKGTAKLTKVATSFPGGLQFDTAQDLVGNDQLGPTTCTYELPNPKGACKTATGDPLGVALTSTGKDIYVSDASGGSVYEYTYPGHTLKDTISTGLGSSSPPFGVAADPGLKN